MNGLKIMKNADGSARPTWYAQVTRNGKKVRVNLKVRIGGTIPTDDAGRFNVNGKGDQAFRDSRHAALVELKKMKLDAGKLSAVDREKRIHRMQTGKAMKDTRLDELPALWRSLPRDTPATEARMLIYDKTFKRFADFAGKYAAEHGGVCETINTVTPEMAAAWFNELRTTYAWETVKNQMSLLSGAFKRWATNGEPNPFVQIIKKHKGQGKVQRKPLTGDEIARVFECSRDDAFYHPLIVCAAATGMRLGDVCRLRWADVDLRGGFIDVVTAKAGVRITLPIFGALRKVLEARQAECADNEPFVFPAAAAKYNRPSERSTIIRGVKPFIARAVFGDKPEPEAAVLIGEEPPEQSVENVVAIIEGSRFAPNKKARVIDTYRRFMAGGSYADIAAATGRNKSQSSQDLQAVEELTGRRVRPGDRYARNRKTVSTARELIKRTRVEREIGKNAASIFGWHSFRTGFVSLAIQNGIPLEDVKKIVGHRTSQMTEDYYRPTAKHTAERVKKQMRGTVLEGHTAIGETVNADPAALPAPDAAAVVPVTNKPGDAVRALALARAVLAPDQAATVAAVIQAAAVDANAEPERALALMLAALPTDTQKRIAAVIQAAGV